MRSGADSPNNYGFNNLTPVLRAAAFVTLGWFLFSHPCTPGSTCGDDLWEMTSQGLFETEEDCNLTGSQIFDAMDRSGEKDSRHVYALIYQCVGDDDPRLRPVVARSR